LFEKREKINDEEKATKRKYTPTSWNFEKGYFDLLIKIYHPTSTFPNGGKMTQFLHKLSLNTQVSFLGPLGKCIYHGDGEFKIT
jgi:NAD(P)H-flavin reductase